MAKTFLLSDQELPTQYNLAKYLQQKGYNPTSELSQACFHDSHLALSGVNTELLEYKHHLARLSQSLQTPVMPPTYVVDDGNYEDVVEQISYYPQAVWILKPAFMNNGEGIHIFTHYQQLYRHYQSNQRYGGPHVLQRYITQPHLLQGHKYTLRLFVIVTNQGQAYAYKDGYFNICCEAYTPNDWQRLTPHLTNEHFGEDETPNIYQMPTSKCPNFDNMYKSLKQIAGLIMRAFYESDSHKGLYSNQRSLGIFGFDYIVDDALNVWLLEANHGPWFPKAEDHPLHYYLYDYLWQDLLVDFVEPIIEGASWHPRSDCFTPLVG